MKFLNESFKLLINKSIVFNNKIWLLIKFRINQEIVFI